LKTTDHNSFALTREPGPKLERTPRRPASAGTPGSISWEQLPVGIFQADLSGNYLCVNDCWCDITGFTRDEVEGKTLFTVVHPLDRQRVEEAWQNSVHNFFRCEFRIQTGEGRTTWVLGQALADKGVSGAPVTFVGTITDITEQKRAEEEVRLNEQRFRWAFGSAPEGMALTSINGRFLQVNRCLCQIFGQAEAELLKLRFQDLTHPDDVAASIAGVKALVDGEREIFEQEKRYLRTDGSVVWAYIRTTLLRGAAREPLYFLAHVQDITARKQAEAALREAEDRFWRLVDLSTDGIIIHVQGKVVFGNPAAARILGAGSREALIGIDVLSLVHPDIRFMVKGTLSDSKSSPVLQSSMPEKIMRLDGGQIHVETAAVPFVFNGKSAVQVIFRDVTRTIEIQRERERLFCEVESARDELRLLSQRLVHVQEMERRRLARELHDEIGQELTALRLNIEQIAAPEEDAARGSAHERVSRLLRVVRDLSLDLRPTMLDDLGLLPTVLWHLDRYHSASGITVDFRYFGLDGQRFQPEIETAAYRIVQEALTNVLRHSGVKQAQLMIWISEPGHYLTIQVEDHGAGFDTATVSHMKSSGLSGMRERAMLLGGSLRIQSACGEGTCVTAELPLESRKSEGSL